MDQPRRISIDQMHADRSMTPELSMLSSAVCDGGKAFAGGGGGSRASVESSVFSSVSSLGSVPSPKGHHQTQSLADTTEDQPAGDRPADSEQPADADLFRDFHHVPLYSEIPPRLRQKSPLEMLPDEVVLSSILCLLSPEDLARFGSVCRQLSKWSSDNRLWEQICTRQWGANFVGKRAGGIKQSAWKIYYVERLVKHRSTMSTATFTLERLQISDPDSPGKDGAGREATKVRENRPARGELAAACVYMPKSFEDARTMEMVRVENSAGVPLEPVDRPPLDPATPAKSAAGKKRRGRRGRGLGGSTEGKEGMDALKQKEQRQRQGKKQQPPPMPPTQVLGPSPPPKASAQMTARSGRYTQSPGGSSPVMAPSPPPSDRPSARRLSDGPSFGLKLTSRGQGLHPLKPATPPPGRTSGRSKQPTPPPAAHSHSARRPELNLRAFGTVENNLVGVHDAFSFDASSPYASCVTPTRQFEGNAEEDSDDDSADEAGGDFSNLSHPAYDGQHGGFVASGRSIDAARLRAEACRPAVRAASSAAETRQAHGQAPPAELGQAALTADAHDTCPWHSESLDSFCLQCKTLVCGHCCLFGQHSGHPRITAEEAYRESCAALGRPFDEAMVGLAAKCDAFETRLEDERARVAKAKSLMKKSVRSSIKALRDQLNSQQNLLMEVIREEEESKQAHLGHLAAQLQGVREGLAASKAQAAAVVPRLEPKKFGNNRPAALNQAAALRDAATGAKLTLDRLVTDGLGLLPEIGDFSELEASLDESPIRAAIATLSFGPTTALSAGSGGRYGGRRGR